MIVSHHRLSGEVRRLHRRHRRFRFELWRVSDQEFYEMTLASFAWVLNG